jgi:glutaredoxin-like protein
MDREKSIVRGFMANLLDDKIKEQIAKIFLSLVEPVGIAFFGSSEENRETCADTQNLLTELAGLSDRIHLKIFDIDQDPAIANEYNVENAPATIIGDWVNDRVEYRGIHFYGIPAGHEFTSLIRDILMVSARNSGLSKESRTYFQELDGPVHIQVFVTPTCPYCPQAVALAHQMAYECDFVVGEMIEATEFPDLVEQFGVSGVPHTVINEGSGELIGAVPESALLEKIRQVMEDEV